MPLVVSAGAGATATAAGDAVDEAEEHVLEPSDEAGHQAYLRVAASSVFVLYIYPAAYEITNSLARSLYGLVRRVQCECRRRSPGVPFIHGRPASQLTKHVGFFAG